MYFLIQTFYFQKINQQLAISARCYKETNSKAKLQEIFTYNLVQFKRKILVGER